VVPPCLLTYYGQFTILKTMSMLEKQRKWIYEKYILVIQSASLFTGIAPEDLKSLMDCIDADMRRYEKHGTIFLMGDPAVRVGIVLEGGVQVVRDDIFGNRTILANLEIGDMFGEAFACAGVETLPVSVIAKSECAVLMIDYRKIIVTCPMSCAFHNRMVENMMQILALKNLELNRKIEAVSARTTREKLMVYLTMQAGKAGKTRFDIPFDRQGLADYLAVDRSAMSAELGKMRDEGMLRFKKNHFELLGSQDQ